MATLNIAPPNSYALILGVSSGFGGHTAIELAKAGYHIVGVHLDRAATMPIAEATKADIERTGAKAIFFNVNAADEARRKEVIAAIQQEFASVYNEEHPPSIRVLLHSLAFGSLKMLVSENPAEMLTQKQIEMTMDVMANSLVYWVQDVFQAKLFARGARIFAMTSGGSSRVLPMYGSVSAAKAALESYIRQLALELAPWDITANSILAGVTDTAALRKIPGNDILIDNAMMRNPFHRLTTPENVAKIITLLTHEYASWINGDVIRADGGENAVDVTWWKKEA
ncbi:MAG: SDR family oxidoreductase [Bacteroidota bacterium]|nr:SDR family oxidoreductase [Candidatus Kapabacteria bacterium]MDW8219256.1 SDR family oxidoreductase [Bacteroidota bacterium]